MKPKKVFGILLVILGIIAIAPLYSWVALGTVGLSVERGVLEAVFCGILCVFGFGLIGDHL